MEAENQISIVARFHQNHFLNSDSFGFSQFLACGPTDAFPESVRFALGNSAQKCFFKACGVNLPSDPNVKKILVGQWVKDNWKNSGDETRLMFRVSVVLQAPIETKQDAIEYLVSLNSLIKTPGATALVKLYGVDAVQILRDKPNKVAAELPGYSQKSIETLSEAIRKDNILEDVVETLNKYGISSKHAKRICDRYDDRAPEVVDVDPYRVSLIRGYSFREVDKACLAYGFTRECRQRVRTAVLCAMNDIKHLYGDVCIPFGEFKANVLSFLRTEDGKPVSEAAFQREVTAEIEKGSIIERQDMVFLQNDFAVEKELATCVAKCLAVPPKTDIKPNLEALIRIRQRDPNEVKLAGKQESLLRNLVHHLLVLTGGPGSGKTTAAKAVIFIYEQLYPYRAVTCLAPTGKAAGRMKESTGRPAFTIHRQLGIKPRGNGKRLEPRPDYILPPGLVVIDEFSMVDMYLARAIFAAMPNPADYTVVIIGDTDQLPSIGSGSVLRDLINSGEVPVTHLDVVFRQGKGSSIITNSVKIRERDTSLYYDDETVFMKAKTDADGGYGPTQQLLVRLYRRALELYGPDETIMLTPRHFRGNHKTYEGELCSDVMNGLLREALNPPSPEKAEIEIHKRIFRKGDRVIQTNRNHQDAANSDIIINNGKIGVIMSIVDTSEPGFLSCEVIIRFDSGTVVYSAEDMDDVEHGYAISVHKSQGSEYACAIIPVLMYDKPLLMRNLIYTALSRAKVRAVFVGDEEALSYAIAYGNSRERCTLLAQRIQERMRRYRAKLKKVEVMDETAKRPKLLQFPLTGTA